MDSRRGGPEFVDDVFVAVVGARVFNLVSYPFSLVGGGVDVVDVVDVVGNGGVEVTVYGLWVGCDYGVCVRVVVCSFEQVDFAYLLCVVVGEGVVDVFVPFGRRVLFVIVLWFDEYVHGFFLVGCVSERTRAVEQLLTFGGEGVPGG